MTPRPEHVLAPVPTTVPADHADYAVPADRAGLALRATPADRTSLADSAVPADRACLAVSALQDDGACLAVSEVPADRGSLAVSAFPNDHVSLAASVFPGDRACAVSAPDVVPAPLTPELLAARLSHIRWIAGGTGAGKSTVARLLAQRYDLPLVHGDPAEPGWIARSGPEHPHLYALSRLPPGTFWAGRTPRQAFRATPSVHGETLDHLIRDLLALPADRPTLVDYFGILPTHLSPLLSTPEQAVFLLPTAEFRAQVMVDRHLGAGCPEVLAKRLMRDAYWDRKVRRQAARRKLRTIVTDGARPPSDLADELARHFGLAS